MARTGRPKSKIPLSRLEISIPTALLKELNTYTEDPLTGKPKSGKRARLIILLLEEFFYAQKDASSSPAVQSVIYLEPIKRALRDKNILDF